MLTYNRWNYVHLTILPHRDNIQISFFYSADICFLLACIPHVDLTELLVLVRTVQLRLVYAMLPSGLPSWLYLYFNHKAQIFSILLVQY